MKLALILKVDAKSDTSLYNFGESFLEFFPIVDHISMGKGLDDEDDDEEIGSFLEWVFPEQIIYIPIQFDIIILWSSECLIIRTKMQRLS